MISRAFILIIGASLLGTTANATDETAFVIDALSPPASSVMELGSIVQDMRALLKTIDGSPDAGGLMRHLIWYDNKDEYRQSFNIKVTVRVPSRMPGFQTLDSAMKSDIRVRISRGGVDFADCMLAVEPVVTRSSVTFGVRLTALWDEIKPHAGICDIDLDKQGTQVGIPKLEYRDVLTAYVRGRPYGEYRFLEGYCY